MKKPENLQRKLLGLAAALLVLVGWYLLDLPCLFRACFAIPCPGCGMTRAWLAALRLDFSGAFRWHPMFWCVPLLAVWILYDGKLFPNKKVNILLPVLLLAGILAVYIARLFGFLGGFSLI